MIRVQMLDSDLFGSQLHHKLVLFELCHVGLVLFGLSHCWYLWSSSHNNSCVISPQRPHTYFMVCSSNIYFLWFLYQTLLKVEITGLESWFFKNELQVDYVYCCAVYDLLMPVSGWVRDCSEAWVYSYQHQLLLSGILSHSLHIIQSTLQLPATLTQSCFGRCWNHVSPNHPFVAITQS